MQLNPGNLKTLTITSYVPLSILLSQVFSIQVFLKDNVQTFPTFLCSECLGSGIHGVPQQKKLVFQLNFVTSDRVTLRSILDVIGTVSPLRFASFHW